MKNKHSLVLSTLACVAALISPAEAAPAWTNDYNVYDHWQPGDDWSFADSILAKYSTFHLLNPSYGGSRRAPQVPLQQSNEGPANVAYGDSAVTPFNVSIFNNATPSAVIVYEPKTTGSITGSGLTSDAFASDTGENYGDSGEPTFATGSNAGTGFRGWNLRTFGNSSEAGWFDGGSYFGAYAKGFAEAEATAFRQFNLGVPGFGAAGGSTSVFGANDLTVGTSFAVNVTQPPSVESGGFVGFYLRNGNTATEATNDSSNARLVVGFTGGQSFYRVTDANGTASITNAPYSNNNTGYTFEVVMTSANTYKLYVNGVEATTTGGVALGERTLSTSGTGTTDSVLNSVALNVFNLGGGNGNDARFNNIAVYGNGTSIWDAGGGAATTTSTTSNWAMDRAFVPGDYINFAGNSTSPNSAVTVTVDSALSVSGLAFDSGFNTPSNWGAVTVGASGAGGFTITTVGSNVVGIVNNNSNTQTINAPITLGNSQTWNAEKGNLVIGGNIDLQGNTLTIAGFDNGANTARDVTISGAIGGTGGVTKTEGGILTLTGANLYEGTTTISGGTLQLGNGTAGNDGTIGNSLSLVNNGSLIYNRFGTTAYNGVISGTGSVTKSGTGTQILGGANTYSGATTIKAGALQFDGSGNANNSTINLGDTTGSQNATLNLNGVNQTYGSAVNVQSGNTGTMTINSLNESGTNTLNGTITLNKATTLSAASGGTLAVNTITGTSTANTLTVGGAGTVRLGGTADNTNLSINATSGTLILEKSNSGPGNFGSGVRSLGGTLTLSGGTVQLGGTGQGGSLTDVDQIYNGGDVVVNSGVFDMNGRNEAIDGFSGAGGIVTNTAGSEATPVTSMLTVGSDNTGGSYAGAIQDGGAGKIFALAKTGFGTLTLTNASNTYSGGTTINGGTISVASAGSLGNVAGGLTINAATLQTTASFTTLRLWTLGSAGSTIDVSGAGTLLQLANASNSLTGAGSLTKVGAGTLQLDTLANYSGGATNVQNGTLRLGTDSALPTGTAVTLGSGSTSGILDLNGKTEEITALNTSGNGTGNRVVNGNATAGALTLNITGTSTFGGILGNTGQDNFSLVKTGAGTLSLTGTANTFSGGIAVNAGTLSVTGNGSLGSGPVSLANATTFNNTGSMAGAARLFNVSTVADATVTFNTGGTLSFTGAGNGISGGSSSATLVKTGSGTLGLSANTQSVAGTWRLDQGTIETSTDSGLGAAGNDISLNGGTFRYTGSSGTLTLGSGRVITVNGVSGNTIATSGGTLVLGSVNQLTGAGALAFTNGILALNASNDYSGAFSQSSGTTLVLGADNALGTGSLIINSGSNGATVRAFDSTARSLASTNVSITDTGTVTFGDTGATPAGTGSLTFGSLTIGGLNRTVSIANSGTTVTFAGLDYQGGSPRMLTIAGPGNLTIAGDITNAPNGGDVLRQAGTGVLSINGVVTGSAANILYRMSSGVIAMNSAGAFGNSYSDKFNFDGNSTFRATNTFTIGTNGTGSFSINNGSTATFDVANSAHSLTVAGAIGQNAGNSNSSKTGNGALTKVGAGTLILTGANTYSGGTAVDGGTLLVNNSSGSATGGGAVTVNNNGTTLGGNGIITGPVTVNAGANLSPGNSAGTLTTGALTLASNSNFVLDLVNTTRGTGYDQLFVNGTVSIGGSNLVLNIGGPLSIGDKFFVLLNNGSDVNSGTFSQGLVMTSGDYAFAINYADSATGFGGDGGFNDISLTVTAVPEPSTWAAGSLALLVLGFTQRRRLRRVAAARNR